MDKKIFSYYQLLLASKSSLLDVKERISVLKKLNDLIDKEQEKIIDAINKDLKKPYFESYTTEVAMVKKEINYAIKNLFNWSKEKRVNTPLSSMPGSSLVKPLPKGLVLIIAPWNYPFLLSLAPLISAIAAGNCAIIKPSELAPHTARFIAKLINDNFDHIRVVTGDSHVAKLLLALKFDHIFYTGSYKIAKYVMEQAAKHITPLTLELGGKSPCVVDKSANVMLAAKRILWGKCVNAGQTCIAPDYVLIDQEIKAQFIEHIKHWVKIMFDDDVAKSQSYGRIINRQHFKRLTTLLNEGQIIFGGKHDEEDLFISPTLIDNCHDDSPLLTDEIFGPILPLLSVEHVDQVISFIDKKPKPLVIYAFGHDKKNLNKLENHTSSGAFVINDCLSQASIIDLPFGGIGESGFGNYHGYYGFLTFSHMRAIHKRSSLLDNPIRYAPYTKSKLKLAKMVLS